ncbi:MAG: IS21 family transposase [Myxococcota bacterium]
MNDVREVLRRWQAGQSLRAIARDGVADRKTVRRYVEAAQAQGMTRETALEEARVTEVLRAVQRQVQGRPSSERQLLAARRAQLEKWLSGEGALKLTRVHELLDGDGVEVSYSTLRRFAHEELGWRERRATVRVDDPPAGEEAQMDFGKMGTISTPSGPKTLWVLVVVLSRSRYAFVYPTFDQTLPAICEGLDAAWRFFGGVVLRVVPDNPKPIMLHASSTAPRLNPSFQEYAEARGFFVDAARVRHPQDKPRVENHIRYVRERWFKGAFLPSTLPAIRDEAERWCREVAGGRIHGTTRRVPREDFLEHEQPHLQPPSKEDFDVPSWHEAKVHPDHHISLRKALYSVPTRYLGQRVRVRLDRRSVRIYFRNELVKTHPRVGPVERSTDVNDYPPGRAEYATRSIDGLLRRAHQQGESIGRFAEGLLDGPLPWTRMRQAYALLRLCEKYGSDRVNALCQRSLEFDVFEVPRVERMLRNAQRMEEAAEGARKVARLPEGRFARPHSSFQTMSTEEASRDDA